MGVKHLWDIIDEIKTKESLEFLRGKVVSVDLSIWIVQAIKTLQFQKSILKPHLRNIIYRILALRKIGIKLLFVTEGEAPDLKQNTMKKRNEARYGVKSKTKGRVGRSRFQNTIKECCQLLDLLGMPYIRAAGEAEAMCAVLNSEGYSDGCLTNDGDFFLYGGETIFQDFGIDPKDPHVYVYKTSDIKKRLNLDRNDMIGLALIAGCDYTDGIIGVGKGSIKKFLLERNFSEDFLTRFKKWSNHDFLALNGLEKSEVLILKKAIKTDDFLNQDIIDEYLISKDHLHNVRDKLKWEYPNIRGLQEFLNEKMEWPFDYTLSKIMQLASSTYLEKLNFNTFYPVVISPVNIVKTRCQYGVSLVEIKWEKDDSQCYNVDMRWENCPDSFNTIENHHAVLKSLPGLVEKFTMQKEAKKSRLKKKGKDSDKNVECIEETISKDVEHENKKESSLSSVKESQDSPGSLLQRTTVSCDFLDDVLCDDMKVLSLDIKEENDEHVKENVPPLFERLQKNKQKENDNEGTPRRNPMTGLNDSGSSVIRKRGRKKEILKKLASNETELSQKQKVSELFNDSISPMTSITQITAYPNIQHFTPGSDKCVENKYNERTPVCLKFETPSVQNQTAELLASLGLTSSTPFEGNYETHIDSDPVDSEITNFSNLGDSILDHSMDLFQNKSQSVLLSSKKSVLYESLDLSDNKLLISKGISLGDSILFDSLNLEISSKPSDKCLNIVSSLSNEKVNSKNNMNSDPLENYEDIIRRKFHISLNCTGDENEYLHFSNLSLQSNDISEIDAGSPLSLAERLKERLIR